MKLYDYDRGGSVKGDIERNLSDDMRTILDLVRSENDIAIFRYLRNRTVLYIDVGSYDITVYFSKDGSFSKMEGYDSLLDYESEEVEEVDLGTLESAIRFIQERGS